MSNGDKYKDCDLEALVEVADGSQWTVTARSMLDLIWKSQSIIGRDLKSEKYYVREVMVNGRFDSDALNEFMAGLRG